MEKTEIETDTKIELEIKKLTGPDDLKILGWLTGLTLFLCFVIKSNDILIKTIGLIFSLLGIFLLASSYFLDYKKIATLVSTCFDYNRFNATHFIKGRKKSILGLFLSVWGIILVNSTSLGVGFFGFLVFPNMAFWICIGLFIFFFTLLTLKFVSLRKSMSNVFVRKNKFIFLSIIMLVLAVVSLILKEKGVNLGLLISIFLILSLVFAVWQYKRKLLNTNDLKTSIIGGIISALVVLNFFHLFEDEAVGGELSSIFFIFLVLLIAIATKKK